MGRAQAATRFQLLLIGVFAAIAAILAGVGLYGVLATLVRQRTAEVDVLLMAAAVAIGPYVQDVRPDGFTVAFETASESDAEVRVDGHVVKTHGVHHEAHVADGRVNS